MSQKSRVVLHTPVLTGMRRPGPAYAVSTAAIAASPLLVAMHV
ncbi:hypothetical protein [Streptomyces sp. NPDC090036]